MIRRIASLVILVWSLGFGLFTVSLPQPAGAERTDAVVVLTGGKGRIERGQTMTRTACPNPEWSIERLLLLRLEPQRDPAGLRWLSTCEGLSPEWQSMYGRLADRVDSAGSDRAEQ